MRCLLLLCLLSVAFPAFAQDQTPSWCPVRDDTVAEVFVSPQPQYTEVEIVDLSLTVTGQLSSDGTLIAYTRMLRDVPVELWVVNADGTNQRVLLYIEDLVNMREDDPGLVPGIHRYEWVPNTHTLLVNTGQFPISEEGIFEFVADDLWLLDADTSEAMVLLPQGEGGEFVLSPGGEFVVVQKRDQLVLIDSDGDNLQTNVLPGYNAPGMGHVPFYPPIVWEDAQSFLTLTATDPYSQHDAEVTIWRVSSDGESQALRTVTAALVSVMFSPDAEFITYWNTPAAGSNQRRLYVALSSGDESLLFLDSENLEFSGWLPDARHFYYHEHFNDGQLLVGDVCGGSEPASEATDTP